MNRTIWKVEEQKVNKGIIIVFAILGTLVLSLFAGVLGQRDAEKRKKLVYAGIITGMVLLSLFAIFAMDISKYLLVSIAGFGFVLLFIGIALVTYGFIKAKFIVPGAGLCIAGVSMMIVFFVLNVAFHFKQNFEENE